MSLPSPPPFRPASPAAARGPRGVLGPPARGPPGACSCSCFLRCLSRLVCCPKHRLHRWHLKGFSLLWMLRTCRWRLEEMLKERSQYLHLEGTRLRGAPGPAPAPPSPVQPRPGPRGACVRAASGSPGSPNLEGGHGEAVLEAARLREAGMLPSTPWEEDQVGMCPEVAEGSGYGGRKLLVCSAGPVPQLDAPARGPAWTALCPQKPQGGSIAPREKPPPPLPQRTWPGADRGEPDLSGFFSGPISACHAIKWGRGAPKEALLCP